MNTAASAEAQRRVQIWDAPTRIFHWGLVILMLIAWFTGEAEGTGATIHRIAGEAIAGLIVFRVIWGFAGGEHARFADFAAGPNAILAHIGDLFSKTPHRHLGHNPLGGLAVFLLLIVSAGIVVTGLFASGHESAGPFAGRGGLDLAEAHELLFRVLQGLVVLHLVGVVVETWRARDPLVPAMITGAKPRRADEPGVDARRAPLLVVLIAAIVSIAVAGALMAQPPGATRPDGHGHDHAYESEED